MKIKKDFTKLSSKTPEKRNKQVRKSLSRLINLMITLNQGVLNLVPVCLSINLILKT